MNPEREANDAFDRWAAGYFSWVDRHERMPTDLGDLYRIVRDAYEAGQANGRREGSVSKDKTGT